MKIDEVELSVKTANLIKRWNSEASLEDVRKAMDDPFSSLNSRLTAKTRKEVREVLWNIPEETEPTYFDVIMNDLRDSISRCGEAEQEALNKIANLIEEIKK